MCFLPFDLFYMMHMLKVEYQYSLLLFLGSDGLHIFIIIQVRKGD